MKEILWRCTAPQLPRFSDLRVLVADDSVVNREVAIEALSRLGAQVETVENGAEAVSAAARRSHHIILMDGSMPEMDGFTAARVIRQAEESDGRPRVPIVALTAHVIGAAAQEWQLAGMDAVIHKPFTIAQLAQCLVNQVPQFLIPADETVPADDGTPVARHGDAESSEFDGDAASPLVDTTALEQLNVLNQATPGDFVKRVVRLYSEHAPKACEQLRQEAKSGDADACGSLAHSLKSMSLNIGAVEVARIAAGFEQAARSDRKVPNRDVLDALASTLQRTLLVLAREVGEDDSGRPVIETGGSAPSAIVPVDGTESDLHRAIERQELDVAYQPFVDRAGKQVLGVEALVRWKRGGADNVPPSVFVPIAERTGFIHEIGEWVLRRACQDALLWPSLTVAVNVSPIQFRRPGLVHRIEQILSESAVDPGRVELEVTETALLGSELAVLQTIEQLHRSGVTFALDDFGTGYSSLTSLRRFPFDKIKIDRSFVSNVGLTIDATIVHAVVSIGRALGLKVVAEGVETVEQQRFVTTAGVHAMQGYLFARPMKKSDVAEFITDLHNRSRPPASAAG